MQSRKNELDGDRNTQNGLMLEMVSDKDVDMVKTDILLKSMLFLKCNDMLHSIRRCI